MLKIQSCHWTRSGLYLLFGGAIVLVGQKWRVLGPLSDLE